VSNKDASDTGIARSVTLSDPLPAGDGVSWSIDPAYAGPGTCDISGAAPNQMLACSFGDMAPGDSASVHITSDTTDASAGTYPNTATAAATNAGSVHASATIVVVANTPITPQGSTSTTSTTTTVPPPPLPFTGSNTALLVLVGAALVGGGMALTLGRRRRRVPRS
jgi:LPXTG-motif cell wall-anchored protein